MFPSDFALVQPAGEIVMAPKRKNQNSAAVVITPIDPNSQLSFTGNHIVTPQCHLGFFFKLTPTYYHM
jgi:hypothetical protein